MEQADLALQSNPDLRIAGAHHYGLICSGNSLPTFRTAVGLSARTGACAVMPSAWDRTLLPWDFQITVVGGARFRADLSPIEPRRKRERSSLALASPDSSVRHERSSQRHATNANLCRSVSIERGSRVGRRFTEWPRSRPERKRLGCEPYSSHAGRDSAVPQPMRSAANVCRIKRPPIPGGRPTGSSTTRRSRGCELRQLVLTTDL